MCIIPTGLLLFHGLNLGAIHERYRKTESLPAVAAAFNEQAISSQKRLQETLKELSAVQKQNDKLRPIANFFDLGRFVFEFPLFKAIPHRIELTTIKRQSADDRDFINCLKEIRYVNCEQKSLNSLPVCHEICQKQSEKEQYIYFLNGCLLYTFNAIDEGDVSGIKWIECQPTVPQPKTIHRPD
ncbi:hypothetical protein ACROYT_G015070 [Oculina patagonica]